MSNTSSSNFSSNQQQTFNVASPSNLSSGFINQRHYSYDDLANATGGFSKSNLLGQGGFGYVHKGILPNGKEIAVKSLKSNSGQGEREFQTEVETISRVNHRHLVPLVGYCIAGSQRMLVYDFIPNYTLEYHLHGMIYIYIYTHVKYYNIYSYKISFNIYIIIVGSGNPVMNFPTRLKIATGTAKGFAYIHEDCKSIIIIIIFPLDNIYNFPLKANWSYINFRSSSNYSQRY